MRKKIFINISLFHLIMAFKLISATDAKVGTNIIIDGVPCVVKSMDISKTGNHGHAKCIIEATPLTGKKKKVIVVPGDDRFEVPHIEKRRGQILSVGNKISLMDVESFETLELDSPEDFEG